MIVTIFKLDRITRERRKVGTVREEDGRAVWDPEVAGYVNAVMGSQTHNLDPSKPSEFMVELAETLSRSAPYVWTETT